MPGVKLAVDRREGSGNEVVLDLAASCARGGGGAACANKCAPSSCVPREEYSKVRTSECGITVPPFEGTTRGEANATSTTQCNGSHSCFVWHDARGRALCTFGGPVDVAGNYW